MNNKPFIPSVINNLTSDSTTNALSAYQGKVLNNSITTLSNNLGNYLPLAGGTLSGNIYYKATTEPFVYSKAGSVLSVQAMAKSSADNSSTWDAVPNKGVVVCW